MANIAWRMAWVQDVQLSSVWLRAHLFLYRRWFSQQKMGLHIKALDIIKYVFTLLGIGMFAGALFLSQGIISLTSPFCPKVKNKCAEKMVIIVILPASQFLNQTENSWTQKILYLKC